LRDGKGTLYEGGTRVPLMWSWPGHIKGGTTSDAVVGHIDLYPTLLDLIGLPLPAQQKMDGVSYACVLKQTGSLDRKAFFNYFPHGRSVGRCGGVWVRSGDWKLFRWFGAPPAYELYNLRDDIGETKDLAAAQPARVKELDALIDSFLADTGATYPRPNPAYKPDARPTVARKARDPLGGWVDKTNSAKIEGGILKLQLAGANAFIAIASLNHAGEAVFQFRAKSAAGGPGKMWWRTADQEQFDPKNVVSFDLPGDGDWHEVRVALTVKGTLKHVRLYPASKAGVVQIDWIRLCGKDGAMEREWKF
jgi:hypothetical protein